MEPQLALDSNMWWGARSPLPSESCISLFYFIPERQWVAAPTRAVIYMLWVTSRTFTDSFAQTVETPARMPTMSLPITEITARIVFPSRISFVIFIMRQIPGIVKARLPPW